MTTSERAGNGQTVMVEVPADYVERAWQMLRALNALWMVHRGQAVWRGNQ